MTSIGEGLEAAAGTPEGDPATAPFDVRVYYLAIEPHRGGFRWAVRQFGSGCAVRTGTETFASEVDARKGGRPSLIAACAATRRGRNGPTPP